MFASTLLLAAVPAGEQAASDAWRPAPEAEREARETRPSLRVVEPDGSPLEARRSGVFRTRNGRAEVLRCTEENGLGDVRDLAMTPLGVTFVAAERGLFVTHPSVDTLDPVTLFDGAPRGPPIALHCDRPDRLWILTPTELGCVHTWQGFGRTHTTADGLPPPPYEVLRPGLAGELLLEAGGAVFAYRPDSRPPRLEPLEGTSRLEGNTLSLEPRASAWGGATFRYRLALHHLLRPLEGGRIVLPSPGVHDLSVYALDRDLDLSEPREVRAHVPYPARFDRKRLVPALVLACALVFAVAFRSAARRVRAGAPRGPALRRAFGNGSLALVLGLQGLGGVLGYGRGFPFIGFAMYRETYGPRSVVYRPEFLGLGADGTWSERPASYLSYATDGTWRTIASLLYGDEASRRAFVEEYSRWTPAAPIRGYELRVRRYRLTREGPARVAPFVMARYVVPPERTGEAPR